MLPELLASDTFLPILPPTRPARMDTVPPPLEPPSLFDPWRSYELVDEEPVRVALGPRYVQLTRRAAEIWLGRDRDRVVSGLAESTVPPASDEDLEWTRWATPAGEHAVRLHPALPDRVLVLKPEDAFRLLPRAEARVYVRVPLWIRFELEMGGGERLLLDELPVIAMSDTWWGSVTEGELAYWLPTTARRRMRRELHRPYLAVCPLHLVNRSGAALEVEKLAFRVAHLSLFLHDGQLWADESRVTYQGEAEGSQIDMSGSAPLEAPGGMLVTPPRLPVQRSFRARTFQRLLSFGGVD